MIFSLFWEGAFIRRGAFIRGGAFILKSEILGGVYSRGPFIRGGAFIRGNTVHQIVFELRAECKSPFSRITSACATDLKKE